MKFLLLIILSACSITASAQNTKSADINKCDTITNSVKEKLMRLYQLQLVLTELDSIKAKHELQPEGIDAIYADEEVLLKRSRYLESLIESRLLSSFKRIRITTRNKVAIVCLNEDACSGCSSKVPQNRLNDILGHKKIVVCQYCGRILIDPKLALSVHVFK